jgi:hypothetical protein
VDAQAQQLAKAKEQLAIDARYLLNSVELQAFIAQVQTIPPRRRWNQTEPAPEIEVKPSPDTVEVLRHYQQQGMQYRAHQAFVCIGQ